MTCTTTPDLKRFDELYNTFDNSINKLRGGDATNSLVVAHQNYNEIKWRQRIQSVEIAVRARLQEGAHAESP